MTTMFTETVAGDLAERAATAIGLTATGPATLIRMGEHGMFRMGAGVIARVARGPAWQATAERELAIARYLNEQGVPCGQPLATAPVVDIAGHPVTFWQELDPRRATFPEIGTVLATLHHVPLPETIDLPELNAFERVAERLRNARIDEDDRTTLLEVTTELEHQWAEVELPSRRCIIHGDGACTFGVDTVLCGEGEAGLPLFVVDR